MLPPRPLLAVCLLLLGGLAWSVGGQPAQKVALAEAATWEGQSIRLEGWAQDVRKDPSGALRLHLVDGAASVAVRVPSPAEASAGERLVAVGRLTRSGGNLALLVEDAADLRRVAGPPGLRPSWHEVAESPQGWAGRSLTLAGTLERATFSAEGRSVAVGQGPWPREGTLEVTGLLRFEPDCLCYVLDAREVRAWTP
jgi:hypothetical protein